MNFRREDNGSGNFKLKDTKIQTSLLNMVIMQSGYGLLVMRSGYLFYEIPRLVHDLATRSQALKVIYF